MTDLPNDPLVKEVSRVLAGLDVWAEQMRARGIHVGLGAVPLCVCVNCGKPWPCDGAGSLPEQAQR